jgi:hypothetical protein
LGRNLFVLINVHAAVQRRIYVMDLEPDAIREVIIVKQFVIGANRIPRQRLGTYRYAIEKNEPSRSSAITCSSLVRWLSTPGVEDDVDDDDDDNDDDDDHCGGFRLSRALSRTRMSTQWNSSNSVLQ